jgi:taurine dioxygenase
MCITNRLDFIARWNTRAERMKEMTMQSNTKTALVFKPLTDTVGAEIIGLDMSKLSADDRSALYEAWLKYHVLVIREQPMTEEIELDFAQIFGGIRKGKDPSGFVSPLARNPEIMVISNIRADGVRQGALPDGEMDWHFDGLYFERPYVGAVLHGVELPRAGGETRFKNMCAVYESLPADLRKRLDTLSALSMYDYTATNRADKKRDDSVPRAVHPVVRIHEKSGKKALYLARLMTDKIVELSQEESDALLDELFDYVDAFPSFYEHLWKYGDTVIWDNRAVAHSRNDFSAEERRLLNRVTIVS